MPSINRIRVNNVKYNFGTQFYDDFTMRLYGKNTLYDLANGGGKSVLMLLLLQNMIPNCTLDEKQPIEKLFRTGNGNTTIHSLVEWKLEDGSNSEGYRYMTTGFCARKAKESEEASAGEQKDVASIEYFNYCIFYREFNKNDIINLPLVKDGERISFQGLKSYLKELPHKDMSLDVKVFERKGEYQRFISGFGIHESQWEIIRGINKTEGHVRTYFENNYKTTRKVVEDLLIEEIIEKAYMVKTERDEEGSDSMAKMLMDIKEQLTVLAQKKKDISLYDHQIELIELLSDKVASFMDIYQEQDKLSKLIANICVTGEEFAKQDEQRMEELARIKDEKRAQKNKQREKKECLKVSKDKRQIEQLKSEVSAYEKKLKEQNDRLNELTTDLNLKESINEYLEYIEDRKKYYQLDAVIKNMMSESSFDEETMYTYAYNIKMRLDVMLTDIRSNIQAISDSIEEEKSKKKYREKMLHESKISLAVAQNEKKNAEEEIVTISEKLSAVRMSMNNIKFAKLEQQMMEITEEFDLINEAISNAREAIDNYNSLVQEERQSLMKLEVEKAENDEFISKMSVKEQEFNEASEKLNNIKSIYGASEVSNLPELITSRITQAILDIHKLKDSVKESQKKVNRLKEGRIIAVSKAAATVIDYIETRHGITAMYGMDYLSALEVDDKRALLDANPDLPYGVVVKDFDTIREDQNISSVDTGECFVNIYDMDNLEEKAIRSGENVFTVRASREYLTSEDTVEKLIESEEMSLKEYEQQLEMREEMLETYHLDHEFVLRLSDSEFLNAGKILSDAKQKKRDIDEQIEASKDKLKDYQSGLRKENETIKDKQQELEKCLADKNKLFTIEQLTDVIKKQEDIVEKCNLDIARLEETVEKFTNEANDENKTVVEAEARIKELSKKELELENEWNTYYKSYYNIDQEYEILTLSDDEIKARFIAGIEAGKNDAKAIEDKRMVMDTIKIAMDRSLKSIDKRGVSIDKLREYESSQYLYQSDDSVLEACRANISDTKDQISECEKKLKDKISALNRLEGSVEYAIRNIMDAFGQYVESNDSLSEIVTNLENGEELLIRLEKEAKACEEEYKVYLRQQGYMIELYKDVKRIVTTNEISLDNAKPIDEDKEKLREIFEENLLKFDKVNKNLDRAKNELLKFKGTTATTLDQMEVYELAATIRDDVVIPIDYDNAKALMENLKSIADYIRLEKDRILKSLVDMETIKENFEEQCLQRCLDVRTELDKLPKLSRIIADDEPIQMVGLTVPYVKDEFLKQRMSEYIDKVVSQADDYQNDKDRIKFIRNSLALKKLFGVIVTDMNAIKLNLYKRERIREQSRYLKYEEAVGSTGQSQGIYIQFLVSIINYISGMYQVGNEDVRTKTIFIDNPFGAAKDVYIWEPIFALLKANNVQLIVPARGATPAITGRFDVNYILGQQMSGGKQLTVVTDYTSNVEQEKLEYHDLEFEQVSFDFI